MYSGHCFGFEHLEGIPIAQIRKFDIGCEPSPSTPAETLLAGGFKTYLLFSAVSKDVGESGFLTDRGNEVRTSIERMISAMELPLAVHYLRVIMDECCDCDAELDQALKKLEAHYAEAIKELLDGVKGKCP